MKGSYYSFAPALDATANLSRQCYFVRGRASVRSSVQPVAICNDFKTTNRRAQDEGCCTTVPNGVEQLVPCKVSKDFFYFLTGREKILKVKCVMFVDSEEEVATF